MVSLSLLIIMAHTVLSMETACPSKSSSMVAIKETDTVRLLITISGVGITACTNACCQYTDDVCWAAQMDADNNCSLYYCLDGQCPTEPADKHWSVVTIEPQEWDNLTTKPAEVPSTEAPQLETVQAEMKAAAAPSSDLLIKTTTVSDGSTTSTVSMFTEAGEITNKEETKVEHEVPIQKTSTPAIVSEVQITAGVSALSTVKSSQSPDKQRTSLPGTETLETPPPSPEKHETSLPAAAIQETSPPAAETHETSPPAAETHETSPPAAETHETSPPAAETHETSPSAAETHATSLPAAETHETSPPAAERHETSPPAAETHETSPPAAETHETSPPAAETHETSPPAAETHETSPPAAETHETSPPAEEMHATSPPAEEMHATSPPAAETHATSPPAAETHATSPPAAETHETSPLAVETHETSSTAETHEMSSPSPLQILETADVSDTSLSSVETPETAIFDTDTIIPSNLHTSPQTATNNDSSFNPTIMPDSKNNDSTFITTLMLDSTNKDTDVDNVDNVIENSNKEITTAIPQVNKSEAISHKSESSPEPLSANAHDNDTAIGDKPVDNGNHGGNEDNTGDLSVTESDWWLLGNTTKFVPGTEESEEVINEEYDDGIEESSEYRNLKTKNQTVKIDAVASNISHADTNETGSSFVGEMPTQSSGPGAMSAALIAALSFGIVFFFAVFVLVGKKCFEGWQRRHYSRIDYLVNGMYN